ncbi:MAG: hypothetical protein ACI9DJ_000083 [Algoriphagus sp.]|jgi:hypothetical protein
MISRILLVPEVVSEFIEGPSKAQFGDVTSRILLETELIEEPGNEAFSIYSFFK